MEDVARDSQTGNRTQLEETAGAVTTITTYVYDAADQLVTGAAQNAAGGPVTTITYGYDAVGNQTSSDGTTNQWSVDNRLVKVTQPGSVVTTMAYDADGLRVRKEDAGGVVKSIWDFRNLVLETDGANAIQAVYTSTPMTYGVLISQRRGATSHFALYDALGSVIGLTNSAGALTDSYRYKAYGSDLVVSGSTVNPFRWIGLLGYYYDAGLGTYYIRARHYHLAIARWLSRDPLGYAGSLWNLYSYSWQNPTTWTDPSGLHPSMAGCFSFNPFSIFTRSGEDVVNDCGLSTSEERRMFQHWTGNSGNPYKIPDKDVCDMGRNSPVLSAELDRLRNACLSGRPLPDPPPGGFPAPPPYQGGIGSGRYEIRSTCNNGCFCYELIITDVYDFDWKFFKRSFSNELKTMAVSCTISGTDYDVVGTCRDCFGPGCSPRLGPQPIPF